MNSKDKRGRLFGINIVDLVAVLLLIAVVMFVVYKTGVVNPNIAPATTPYRLTLLIEGVRQETLNELKVGLDARAFDAAVPLGKISVVDVTPALEEVPTADGRVVEAEIPNRFDVRVGVDTQAIVTDKSIRIANSDLTIGLTYTIVGQRYLIKGVVIGLQEIK